LIQVAPTHVGGYTIFEKALNHDFGLSFGRTPDWVFESNFKYDITSRLTIISTPPAKKQSIRHRAPKDFVYNICIILKEGL